MGNTPASLGGDATPPRRKRRIRPGADARSLSPLGGACCLLTLSPLIVPWIIWHYGTTLLLCLGIWRLWGSRRALVVYSDSPIWKPHFEAEILPRLQEHAVVLNWSDRRHWSNSSLAVSAFRHFGTARPPIVIVFRPLFFPRSFKYWPAFKDFKHGNPITVQRLDRLLFQTLGI
jgi:hypothetical protein